MIESSKNSKILVCDDDETLCYLLKEQLLEEGFSVDAVYDGKYAIEAVKAKNYDVLLLDLLHTRSVPCLELHQDSRVAGVFRIRDYWAISFRRCISVRGSVIWTAVAFHQVGVRRVL